MTLIRQIKKVQVKTPAPTRPNLPPKEGSSTGYFTSDNVNDLKNLPGLSSAEIVNLTINNIDQKIQNTFNTPSGQDHEVQFKNGAQFDGDQGLKYNVVGQTLTAQNLCVPGTSDLNDVSCLRIRSGNPGFVLTKLDYCGNVTWCDPSNFLANPLCIGTINCCNTYTNVTCNTTKIAFDQDSGFAVTDMGGGESKIALNIALTPGGCNTQVQYNCNGAFSGSAGLTYDNVTGSVGLSKITVPENQNLQITVSTPSTSWWSLYGDPGSNLVEEYSEGVVYDSTGNSYIVGANGDDGIPFLVKYDPDGNVVWQKVFNEVNNYYKTGDAVAVDSSGNVYCMMGTDDSINDVTVFKLSSAGNVIWQTMLTGTAFDPYIAGTDLGVDTSGNVYAAIYYDKVGDESQAIVKLNSAGIVQWQKVISGDNNGYPQGLAVDSAGNIILNGQYATATASSNVLLTKFDSAGNLLWQRGFANPYDNTFITQPGQVTTDSANNIIINGRYQTADNYTNGFVIKLDSSGNLLWQTNFPGNIGTPGYQFYGAAVDASNNIYVTGYGGVTWSNYDYYIIKFDPAGVIQWQRKFGSSASEYGYWYWSAKMIDVFEDSYIINGYSYAGGGSGDAITAQFSTTGSGTGTYGLFTYDTAALTTNTTAFTISTPAMPVTNGILTTGTGIYTVTNGSATDTVYFIGGGENSYTINADGTFQLPKYTLPFGTGTANQVLTTDGSSSATWADAKLYLNQTTCSLRISSKTNEVTPIGVNNFAVGFSALNSSNLNSGAQNNVALGYDSLKCLTAGYSNVAIGHSSLRDANGVAMNIGIGYDTLQKISNSNDNIALGGCSQFCLTTGFNNISLGWQSLKCHVHGNDNIAIGADSQNSNTCGYENISLGSRSLYSNTTGVRNIAIGTYPLYRNTEGVGNIALGIAALEFNTTGSGSIAIGEWALQNNRSGYIVGIGQGALSQNTTGLFNTAIGTGALQLNTTGWHNTAVGYGALLYNVTGYANTAVGVESLKFGSAGFQNTAVGAFSLQNNRGQSNTAVGYAALIYNTTGQGNTAVGSGALNSNTVGQYNIAVGNGAMVFNTTGSNNIAVGFTAMNLNTTGDYNVAIGSYSLYCNTTGSCNVSIGAQALQNNTTGWRNIAIGKNAALYNTFGGENTAIGYNSLVSNTSGCRNFAIGAFALYGMNGGNDNVGIGIGALRNSGNSGCFNIAIGIHAGCCNRGSRNTFIGNIAGASVLTGNSNTIIGNLYGSAGLQCTVLIGAGTCERIKVDNTGFYVNGTCWCSGGATVSAATPTSLGTMFGFTSSNGNTYVGYNGGSAVTTGLNNTIIGSLTGSAGLTCTVLIGAGTCERIKVDNSGLCVNGSPFPNSLYDTFTNLTGATGVVVHNFSLGPIFRHTSVASNFTVNVTNLNLNSGSVTNITLLIIQGATAYIPNAIQIAGVAQTLNWNNGTVPTGNANKVDLFNFSMLNNSGTYLVIGQSATFG